MRNIKSDTNTNNDGENSLLYKVCRKINKKKPKGQGAAKVVENVRFKGKEVSCVCYCLSGVFVRFMILSLVIVSGFIVSVPSSHIISSLTIDLFSHPTATFQMRR
jgi:hypothetical protein